MPGCYLEVKIKVINKGERLNMTESEYWDRIRKAQDWKDKQLDKALSWLDKQRNNLDEYKCPETKALYIALLTDLDNRYKAICQSIEQQWMGMFEAIDGQCEIERKQGQPSIKR